MSSRRFAPPKSRVMRASRLSRANLNSTVKLLIPRLGIEPRRSSHPRSRMKYWVFGREPVRLYAKSTRKIRQMTWS